MQGAMILEPALVGVGTEGSDQPEAARGVGKNPDHSRAPLDLLVEALTHVRAFDRSGIKLRLRLWRGPRIQGVIERCCLFDPTYLLFILPGVGLSLWASFRTKSAFRTYSKVPCARQLTGAQAARLLLDRAGLHHVGIGRSHGLLSDHYNPATRRLALSKDVHDSTSIAAIGVATHEAGHAIQHAAHYAPLWLRSTLVPTANIGSSIGYVVMMIGLFMASQSLVGIGALLFSAVLLFQFQVVTLPVEFDATARAKKLVVAYGIISERERVGMDRVLNAAALTYVAAVVSTLLTLLYFLMRAGLLGGRDD